MYDPKITVAERNAAPDYASAKFSQPIDQAMQKLQVEFAAKYGEALAEAVLDDITIRETLQSLARHPLSDVEVTRALNLVLRASHNTLHVLAGILKLDDETLHAAIEEFAEGYGKVLALGDDAFSYPPSASAALAN